MEAFLAVERAKQELARLTGFKPAAVVGVHQDDGCFHLRVEMVELARIPPSSDVLGSYEAVVNEAGEMVSFERKGGRLRGQPVETAVG